MTPMREPAPPRGNRLPAGPLCWQGVPYLGTRLDPLDILPWYLSFQPLGALGWEKVYGRDCGRDTVDQGYHKQMTNSLENIMPRGI